VTVKAAAPPPEADIRSATSACPPIPSASPRGADPPRGALRGPSLAMSGLPDHAAATTALPPGADIRAAMSALPLISSASPPGADLPGGAAEGPLVTHSGSSPTRMVQTIPPQTSAVVDSSPAAAAISFAAVWPWTQNGNRFEHCFVRTSRREAENCALATRLAISTVSRASARHHGACYLSGEKLVGTRILFS
jgi:hypothetical protein